MLITAAVFLDELFGRFQRGDRKTPLLWLLPVLVLVVLSRPFGRVERANDHANLAVCAMLCQKPGLAVTHYRKVGEFRKNDDETLQLAIALSAVGDHHTAFDLVVALSRREPRNADLAETVAGICDRRGETERARRVREALDRQFPGVVRRDLILEGLVYFRQQAPRYRINRPID